MKFGKFIVLAFALLCGLVSCQQDEDIVIAVLNIKNEVIEPSYTTVNIECSIECNTRFNNVVVEYALTDDFVDPVPATMAKKDGKYRVFCEDLLDDTTYYLRYTISNRYSSMAYDKISSFRTLTPSVPSIVLDSIVNIWDITAGVIAHLEFDGGAPITEWGVSIWANESNDTIYTKAESLTQVQFVLSALQPNTNYRVRAYAINKVGIANSEELTFITYDLPKVQTNEITDIQLTSAILSGTLSFNGNDTTCIKGFCWSKEAEPTIDNLQFIVDTADSTFVYYLSDLQDETQYYVRAFAKNKIGITYGEELSFTTQSAIPPTVTTTEPTDIDYHTAKVSGTVTADGGATVTERGICYSTLVNPTTASTKIISGTGSGVFSVNLINLSDSTTYYVRAYAINKKGTSYGEEVSFMTKGYQLPTVTIAQPTNVSYTWATVGVNVTADGGTEVTERGICYSTSPTATISNKKITSGYGTGEFSVNLSGLSDSTTYYVRAYAINKKGVSYSEEVSFLTKGYKVPTVTTATPTNIEYHTATVGGEVLADGYPEALERGICYSTSPNPTTESNVVYSGRGDGSFTINLTNLSDSTTYYVRAFAINEKGTSYGEQVSFMTKGYQLPTVKTSAPTNILYTSATITGNVISDGGAEITERGICYSTSANPTTASTKIISGTGSGAFSVNLINLSDSTTYYVRAYAINKKGTSYGEEVSFMTKGYKLPTVTTIEPTNINYHTAKVNGEVTDDGGATVTERGICYSTSANPTTASTKIISGTGSGAFSVNLINLSDSTTYYVRAYAINKKGTSYGEEVSFMTKGYKVPTVTTATPTNIEYHTATVGGEVLADGYPEALERGICYSTSPNPTTESNVVCSGRGDGSFTINLTNLSDSTTYYVRAFAINKKGTSYGKEVSFMTKGYKLPTVTTIEPTNIDYHTAKVNGEVTDDGGATVTERGICYSTSANPTTASTKVTSGTGSGAFSVNLTDLSDSTTYYVRAYAINKKGTSYGEEVSFMTKGYKLPTVTTIEPTNIDYHTAKVSGIVTADGGATVTERGICYSTSVNPTTANTKVTSSKGTGSFSVNLANLSDSTTYYVRAYAINKKGTSYGEEVSFMTKGYKLPTVTTIEPTNIDYHTAKVNAEVTDDGGATVTERGICYSTSANPTTASTKVTLGTGSGAFSVNLTDLSDSTTYYVRAYAINRKGTSYGEEYSFMTKGYKLPTVKTTEPTNVSYTSASIGGNVGTDGDPAATERGICYSLSSKPTTDDTKIVSGSGAGSFYVDLKELVDNTTYYVRAYAINKKGTSYGEEVSFTTKDYKLPTLTTISLSNIAHTSATASSSIIADGGLDVSERGFCYSINANPTTEDTKVVSSKGIGSFSANLTNLSDGITYHVRAYAINKKGTAYSEEASFTTKTYQLPTITTTNPASNISYTSATVGGSVVADGGLEVSERGICYSTLANPTIDNIKIASGKGLGSFSIDLTGLTNNTTYYVRAYAINQKGVAYGEEISFITIEILLPTITTTEATNIFNTSAVVGGNITNDGGGEVTDRGVVYHTSPNPTISNTKIANGNGTGAFTCNLTNLQSGTTYYARAYAENVNGVAYGQEISFTTMTTLNFPITTTIATDITCTSAVVGGNITGDGGSSITERGVCYSTSPSPTMSDMTMQKGRGVGIYSCTLTDLQDGETYYVRAYGINSLGISYGEEVSFTTAVQSTPTVTIKVPQYIYSDGATIEADVTNDGCLEVTERGICYTISSTPTENDDKISSTSGVGFFTTEIGGLQENTTYNVCAYAKNSMGISYSNTISFTTKSKTYHDGFEYVDLGLSIKWATLNVGSKEQTNIGDKFAWGETEPKTTYTWQTYEYCNGTAEIMTKYLTNNSYGINGDIDDKIYLDPIDDAAQANLGGDWRMPTREEWNELRNNCTWVWTSISGVKGYRVRSNKNGNSIFLPGAIIYWSSSLMTHYPIAAYPFCITSSGGIDQHNNGTRYEGKHVRPVWCEMELPTVTTKLLSSTGGRIQGNITNDGGGRVVERGICYSTVNNPTVYDMKILAGSDKGGFTCILPELQDGLTYYARAYAINQKGTAYGEEISFTYVAPKYENGYEYIDLGLSVKWAAYNVGASTPEGYGNYFAWGEVEPKTNYNWNTYKWCNGTSSTLTKYCNNSSIGNNGFTDNLTQLEPEDDAATVNWGGKWRMPTEKEWDELLETCTWEWTSVNGIYGYIVTSKINGCNIFLPEGGERTNSGLYFTGSRGQYWFGSLHLPNTSQGCHYYFAADGRTKSGQDRWYGLTIRPVCP